MTRFWAIFCICTALAVMEIGCMRRASNETPLVGWLVAGMHESTLAQAEGAQYHTSPGTRAVEVLRLPEVLPAASSAYLALHAASPYPAGSIFVVGLSLEHAEGVAPILLSTTAGKFYLAPDNGVIALIAQHEGFARAWRLNKPDFYRNGQSGGSDIVRDILAPVAARLASGTRPETMGSSVRKNELAVLSMKPPVVAGNTVTAEVIWISPQGYVVTNLTSGLVGALHQDQLLRLTINGQTHVGPLIKNIGGSPSDRLCAIFNEFGYLQLMTASGSAAKQTRVSVGNSIVIRY